MTTDPFGQLNAKRIAGDKKVILAIGDSTVIGYGSGNDGGWLTRLGIAIGVADNIDVFWMKWDEQKGWLSSDSVPNTWTQINTGTSGNAPLYIYDGAMGGHDLLCMQGWLAGTRTQSPKWPQTPVATGYVAEQPDLIFQCSVVNDYVQPSDNAIGLPATSLLTYKSRYDTVVGLIQAQMPGVPLVITSMNHWEFDSYTPYTAAEAAHIGIPVPTMPLSPALQQAANYSGVWMMDTQQAIPGGWNGGDWTDLWHLNATGNQLQANWMFGYVSASMATLRAVPTILTTTLDPVVRTVPFSQVFTSVTPSHWSLSPDSPNPLPAGLTLTDAGLLSGIPLAFGGTYDFTVRATNDGGYTDKEFTGPIDAHLVALTPTGVGKLWWTKPLGLYPINMKIRHGGSFIGVVARD